MLPIIHSILNDVNAPENKIMEDNTSDFTVEIVTDYTDAFVDYIVDLYDSRSESIKELNINYKAETMRRCFKTGRFVHGFVLVKERGILTMTYGIDDFKGWGVFTRFLTHSPNTWKYPFGYEFGVVFPIIEQHVKGRVIGLCSTHNASSRNFVAIIGKRLKKPTTTLLAKLAAEVHMNIKILDYKVKYRSTVQEVLTFNTDLIPPFDPV
jgi:hypothetical protein